MKNKNWRNTKQNSHVITSHHVIRTKGGSKKDSDCKIMDNIKNQNEINQHSYIEIKAMIRLKKRGWQYQVFKKWK